MVVTAKELIEILEGYPSDTPVILSTDEEGNEIRMVNGAGARYVTELQHRFMEDIDEEDIDEYDDPILTVEVW